MSQQVTTATVQAYANMVEHLLQQKGSKLLGKVKKRSFTGKAAKALEQIGKQTARERTTRHADTVYNDTIHKARWCHPKVWDCADLVDTDDAVKMLINAPAEYAVAQSAAIGRIIDQHICDTLLGTSYTGENGTTQTAFDTANQQVALGGTGMNVTKMLDAQEKLRSNDWDDASDPLMLLVGSKQYRELLEETKVGSGDFNRQYVMESGRLTTFLGAEIIHISDSILPTDANGDRRCIMFPRSAYVLGEWGPMKTRIEELPTKNYSTQIYSECIKGGTRTEEGKVVEILCDE